MELKDYATEQLKAELKRRVELARAKDTDIEYTRTDAFIKEVCEWLDNELCCYIKAQDFTIDHARLNKDLRKHLQDETW